MVSQFYAVSLELTPAQIRKLASGLSVQIPHSKLLKGIEVIVKKRKASKVHRSATKGKGVRLNLDPEEFQLQGGAFLDVLKKAGKFIKEKVFTNPIYKQHVAPLIKAGLLEGVKATQGLVGSKAPMLSGLVGDVGREAVGKLGEVSGAYGLRYGTALNPHVPMADSSHANYQLAEVAAPVRRGALVKGSAEAKEWGARMRAAKMAKGGSFRAS